MSPEALACVTLAGSVGRCDHTKSGPSRAVCHLSFFRPLLEGSSLLREHLARLLPRDQRVFTEARTIGERRRI